MHQFRTHLTAVEARSQEEEQLHINVSERKAVCLGLDAFLDTVAGESAVLMSNNAIVITYLKKQGGTMSKALCNLAQEIILWSELHFVTLSVSYIPGKMNVLADQPRPGPSHGVVSPSQGVRLDLRGFRSTSCGLVCYWGNSKLPLYVFPVPDPMAWKQDTFQHPSSSLVSCQTFKAALLASDSATVASTEWFIDLLDLFCGRASRSPFFCVISSSSLTPGNSIMVWRPLTFMCGGYQASFQKGWFFERSYGGRH